MNRTLVALACILSAALTSTAFASDLENPRTVQCLEDFAGPRLVVEVTYGKVGGYLAAENLISYILTPNGSKGMVNEFYSNVRPQLLSDGSIFFTAMTRNLDIDFTFNPLTMKGTVMQSPATKAFPVSCVDL